MRPGHEPPAGATDVATDGVTDGVTDGASDVVVVGGGAAGLAAATTARAAGLDVTLVSAGPLGGDCTWHGCVPTKALLEAAAAGVGAADAVAHVRAVVARVARGESEHVLRGAGVHVRRARATLHPGPTVALDDRTRLRPRSGVVLATGSRPRPATALAPALTTGPRGSTVATTDGWLDAVEDLVRAPGGPVVVVGGGASGVELAQALVRLRVAAGGVVLLEREPVLLPGVPGAGAVVAASLAADGVDVRTGCRDDEVAAAASGAPLVLLAVGREPVLDVLAPGCGVATGPHGVLVDATMATTAAGVWAAGDVTGLQPSTHLAAAGGRAAVAGLLGRPLALDPTWAPQVVYTDPEVAVVGRPGPSAAHGPAGSPGADVAADKEGADGADGAGGARTVRVPLSRSDRAVAAAVPAGHRPWTRGGFVQVWVDDGPGGGRVTGAVLVGPHAGELVAEVALVGRLGTTVEEWAGGRTGLGAAGAHHAYPTWSWLWQPVLDRLLGR